MNSNNLIKNKVTYKLFLYKLYIYIYIYIYIYKQYLALNNPQELISHKESTNQLSILVNILAMRHTSEL